ncbi:hypothetical protein, partial [Herminiimonas sp. CN]|uniref:hypothetical protein n=1 Tax=Herminiimonas sp. CN TaxID=1349818 RepID=UPI001EE65DAB
MQSAEAERMAPSSSAHTYRLLIVKDLLLHGSAGIFYRTGRAAKRFVCSTEEVRLCSASITSSTCFLTAARKFHSLAHPYANSRTACFCLLLP